jgi:hypothetical protein
MTPDDQRPARRSLTWPDVTGLGIAAGFVLGLIALAIVCAGRLW